VGITYKVFNGPAPTTAVLAPVTTGTSLKTMLQLAPNIDIIVTDWGCSFGGSSAATPGSVELIDTGTVFATVTAFAAADVQPQNNPYAPANGSGSTGTPLGLGTALSGYTSTAEGSITSGRLGGSEQIAPTNQYWKQLPLSREFGVKAGDCLRIRMLFGAAVNALCYVEFEKA
jgi:hypothetical protein